MGASSVLFLIRLRNPSLRAQRGGTVIAWPAATLCRGGMLSLMALYFWKHSSWYLIKTCSMSRSCIDCFELLRESFLYHSVVHATIRESFAIVKIGGQPDQAIGNIHRESRFAQ